MKTLTMTLLLAVGLLPMAQALADDTCSTKAMAGRWVYVSAVSQQVADPQSPAFAVSSLGTVNIDKNGKISGVFDFNALGFFFIPDITYTGSITVNPDCRGTFHFVNSFGFEGTDSIVVVDRNEYFGMSQNPLFIFSYQVRRISGNKADHDDD